MNDKPVNNSTALNWLYDQLRRKRISLGHAETKPGVTAAETEGLQRSIEILEWLTAVVLERSEDGAGDA